MHEARTAASLRHPNIVAVHEVGSEAGQIYIASDYIEGLTIRDLLSKGKLQIGEVLSILVPVTRAVHYAHERGVVHRDIKPANILLNVERVPSVTDFGIAKRLSDDDTKSPGESASHDGQIVGTAKYMSPEQAGGKTSETDRRSDIYSLGVLLFEMLTGEVPFRGNMRAITNQKLNDEPPSPRTLNPRLPRDLETICLKCLERQPAKRYQTARELADELERFQNNEPIVARPVSKLGRLWRWCRRRPLVASLMFALFLNLSIGLTGVTFFWRQAEHNAERSRQSLYRSRMNLAGMHLGNGDIAGVRALLDLVADDPELNGIRGFEFDFYSSLIAPLRQVASHGDVIVDVAVTRDGDLCASIGRERRIRVWETQTGAEVRSLTVDTGRFRVIEFSPSTGLLVSGSNDGFLRIWNPRIDARLVQQVRHGPQITCVRFSSDGRRMLSLGANGPVRVWDTTDFSMVAEIPSGPSGGVDARFVGDGTQLLVASSDGQLRLWNVISEDVVTLFGSLRNIRNVAVSDDGSLAFAGSYHGELTAWSLPEGNTVASFETAFGRIDDIEFLKGTHITAVAASDGQTHFFDLDSGDEVLGVDTHGLIEASIARAENGKSLLIGNNDGTVLQIKVDELPMPGIFWHDAPIEDLAFLDDGRLIASDFDPDSRVGELRAWNLATGQFERVLDDDEPAVNLLSVQPDGTLIATGGIGSQVLIRVSEGLQVTDRIFVTPTGVTALEFSPSGRRLAIAPRQGRPSIYTVDDFAQPHCEVEARDVKVVALTMSADDRLLAIAWDDGLIQLYDGDSGASLVNTLTLPSPPSALCFCEEDHVLAIGNDIGEIHVWEFATQSVRSVVKGHTARVSMLVELPGERTLVSAGRDRSLKLWDIATGELTATFVGHSRQVFALDISPDGRTIASGSLDQSIRLWRAGPR